MNVESVKTYMIKENRTKFEGIIDFKKVNFTKSKYNGIIVDLDNGIHTLRIGNNITKPQIQRALVLLMIDTAFEHAEEDNRKYLEYGDKVAKVQADYYPVKHVFYEVDGKIVKDKVVDCDETTCTLQTYGKVPVDQVIGLSYREVIIKKP